MATTVDFSTNVRRAVGQQYVYFRQKWQDSWVLYYDVHCTEITWSMSPSIPTAVLVRDYGFVKGLGVSTYSVDTKLDCTGWYVKVVMETNTVAGETSTWYGVVSHVEDEQMGTVSAFGTTAATGRQMIHCYGLEKMLDTEYLSESWVDNGNAAPLVVQLPVTFNKGGKPNRNDRRLDPAAFAYVFEGQSLNPGGTLRPTAQWWSTYHIVDYLLHWATPKESFRTRLARIPFELTTASALLLPTLDRPEIDQEGQTVLSLLQRLIDRRRLRGFYLSVDETRDPHRVQLQVAAWNNSSINTGISGADILLPNTSTKALKYDLNQATTANLRTSLVQRYDRVLVRGARRTSTASWVVDTGYLEAGWTSTEETAYENAASGVTGYSGWDDLKQQQRNAEVRSSSELSPVYSWFKLPDTWAGLTVSVSGTTTYPVFLNYDGTAREPQYIHEVVWESFLPLYERVDYSGTKISTDAVADPPVDVYRRPAVFFKVPTDARWVAGDAVASLAEASADPDGDGRNFRWSAVVYTQPETRTLEVRVAGEQQHVIAQTDFTPLTEDRELGDFDYKSKLMVVTATLRDNRYAEGKYPADGATDTSLIDAQYGFVIYAGDDYRKDYVVPGTVVDVDTDGTLITSDGGYVRDDTGKLSALARIAYEWWHQERVILSLATSQLTSAIRVGDFIETIGEPAGGHYQTVNTVVTEIGIRWPRLEGNQLDSPTLTLVTGAGELDPMTLAPKMPDKTSRVSGVRR